MMDNLVSPKSEQITVWLAHLCEPISALKMSDGKLYIPVVAICNLLSIDAPQHIRRWRQMLLWEEARKLPYRHSSGYQRTVWCLPLPLIPLMLGYFDWQRV